MARGAQIECVSYVRMPDGGRVPFADLSDREKQDIRQKISENVGRTLGRYFSEHPEQLDAFSRCKDVRLIPEA